jgi:hypothetical protein
MSSMRRKLLAMAAGGLLTPGFGGCMMNQPDARYIYQDGEYGVIGVPQNSPFGFKDYERQAKELMARHFPGGYEVVRAEEVVEGQRVLDRNRTSQITTDPVISALNQNIKLGQLAETRTTQQKDSTSITESRIIYKKRSPRGPSGADGFAARADLIPEFYLDPNELMRARNQVELAEAKVKEKNAATIVAEKAKDASAKPPDPATAAKTAAAPAKAADPTAQKASFEVKKQ